MWKLLIGNPYVLLGIGAAVVASFLYVRFLQGRVDHWRNQHDQVQATLNIERETHKQAMDEAVERDKRNLAAASAAAKATADHLQERITFHASNADALAKRLRDAERSRVRPLAPATSAPAECRDYAADPTRLSEEARGFFIGEAAAAEEQGELLLACRKDYAAVRLACGIAPH